MNPFDLRGPEFLLFYSVVAVAVLLAIFLLRRALEKGPMPRFQEVDPYAVAYLRGGRDETLRVTVAALLDRGLLERRLDDSLASTINGVAQARRPVEQEVLRKFLNPGPAGEVLRSDRAQEACGAIADELRRLGLLPNGRQIGVRVAIATAAIGLLTALAGVKMAIAVSRGRHNIGFLFLLALAADVVVVAIVRARRTTTGSQVLADLRQLFSALQQRADSILPGGATNEMALLLGVFGGGALVGDAAFQYKRMFPTAQASGGSDSSSCGSSCGGGCGGGGCGGCGS